MKIYNKYTLVGLLIISTLPLKWYVTAPRLSAESLNSLESQSHLKRDFVIVRITRINGSAAELTFAKKNDDQNGWMTDLPNPDPKYRRMLGVDNFQAITNLVDQLGKHGINWMVADRTVTIFMDGYGNRYLRWKKGIPKTFQFADQMRLYDLVGTADGGWLVYRVPFYYSSGARYGQTGYQ